MADTTQNPDEAAFYIDGALYSAIMTATPPTSATATLDTEYVGHGLWSSEGLTQGSSKSTQPTRAFQHNILVREITTEGTASVKLVLLQNNAGTASLFYGQDVNTTTGHVQWNPGRANGQRRYVVDKIISASNVERISGVGEVTSMDDRVTTYGNVSGYGITITFTGEVDVWNTEWIA